MVDRETVVSVEDSTTKAEATRPPRAPTDLFPRRPGPPRHLRIRPHPSYRTRVTSTLRALRRNQREAPSPRHSHPRKGSPETRQARSDCSKFGSLEVAQKPAPELIAIPPVARTRTWPARSESVLGCSPWTRSLPSRVLLWPRRGVSLWRPPPAQENPETTASGLLWLWRLGKTRRCSTGIGCSKNSGHQRCP